MATSATGAGAWLAGRRTEPLGSDAPRKAQVSSADQPLHRPRGDAGESPSPHPSPSKPTPSRGTQRPSESTIVAEFDGRSPRYWGEHAAGTLARFTPKPGSKDIALTFDACGGSFLRYDSALIETLRRTRTPATLFVNMTWAQANPRLFEELADDPLFEIANHGARHVPLSASGQSAWGIHGTQSVSEIWHEIQDNAEYMASRGVEPRFMRPGTAHTDDIAAEIAVRLGQPIASFSVNADGGAKFPASMVSSNVLTARPGDIVIGHFNQPGSGTAAGMAEAIPALRGQGAEFVTLSQAFGTTSPSSS